jgi:hypothetical protein
MSRANRFRQLRCTELNSLGRPCGAQATWRVATRKTPDWDYVQDGFLQNYVCDEHEPARRNREDATRVAFEPLDDSTQFGSPIPEDRARAAGANEANCPHD